jgi:hypothetical protein
MAEFIAYRQTAFKKQTCKFVFTLAGGKESFGALPTVLRLPCRQTVTLTKPERQTTATKTQE